MILSWFLFFTVFSLVILILSMRKTITPYCLECEFPKDYWDKPCPECMRRLVWQYRTKPPQ